MPYIGISSLILVFFILFLKESACVDNSVTTVKEIGITVDVYRLYETSILKSVTTTIAPNITFIFKRIHTTTGHLVATFTALLDR